MTAMGGGSGNGMGLGMPRREQNGGHSGCDLEDKVEVRRVGGYIEL